MLERLSIRKSFGLSAGSTSWVIIFSQERPNSFQESDYLKPPKIIRKSLFILLTAFQWVNVWSAEILFCYVCQLLSISQLPLHYFAFVLQNCLVPLMNILKEHIVTMEKEHLISHQSELTAFFMKALDFRTDHAKVACLGGWTAAAQPLCANSISCLKNISSFHGICAWKFWVSNTLCSGIVLGVESITVRYLVWNKLKYALKTEILTFQTWDSLF